MQGWINTYGYVGGNPLRYTDSAGLVVDTVWDIGNLLYDLWKKNWGDAADAAAMCIPSIPDVVWSKKAPRYVSPGTKKLEGQYINDKGNIQP